MSRDVDAPPADEPALRARLCALVRAGAGLMACLGAVRALRLEAWCVGAGAIRQRVWDAVLGPAANDGKRGEPHPPASHDGPDVDVAYVDTLPWSPARDAALAGRLAAQCPGVPWEVVHQAHVPGARVVLPFSPAARGAPGWDAARALESALATWPETATAVGVTLRDDGALHVVAPLGLADLFDGVLRPNPSCADPTAFARRLARKQWQRRWPALRLAAARAAT